MKRKGKKTTMQGLTVLLVPDTKMACTFFNQIFLGTEFTVEERAQILAHEAVHVRQKHSLDLLFFEFLKTVIWFHPVVYLFQRDLNSVHEFLADEVVTRDTPKATYYQNLLSATFGTRKISFINQFFNHSLIKKRIVMLQKTRSPKLKKLKYILIVPLLLGMLTYVSCSEDISSEKTTENVLNPPSPPAPPEGVNYEEANTAVVTLRVKDLKNLTDQEKQKLKKVSSVPVGEGNSLRVVLTDGENSRIITVSSANDELNKDITVPLKFEIVL